MAAIAIFLFKRGSRNGMDNLSRKGRFVANYKRMFGCRLPDMDTCDKLLRKLPQKCLEKLKQEMIRVLIRKKVFDRFRFDRVYHSVAIDGTGLHSFDYEPYPGCPKRTSKSGKTTYTVYVLEAKIVCSNGFSISIATEWIRNPEHGNYDKQEALELEHPKQISGRNRFGITFQDVAREFPELNCVPLARIHAYWSRLVYSSDENRIDIPTEGFQFPKLASRRYISQPLPKRCLPCEGLSVSEAFSHRKRCLPTKGYRFPKPAA